MPHGTRHVRCVRLNNYDFQMIGRRTAYVPCFLGLLYLAPLVSTYSTREAVVRVAHTFALLAVALAPVISRKMLEPAPNSCRPWI